MKILYVHQGLHSFTEQDMFILSSAYEVRSVEFTGGRGLIQYFVPKLWQIWKGLLWCDLSFIWFGKLHAFFTVMFSKFLKKPSVIVGGGDDAAKKTGLGRPYGVFSHPIKKWFGYFIFKYADLIIAVSEYNYREIIDNTPALPEKVKLIYHGFDAKEFYKIDGFQKEKAVATVGEISDENCWRKGFELIKKTAQLMPDVQFHIIGPEHDNSIHRLKNGKPPNLIFTGGLFGNDLIKKLSAISVYLQVSEWESFGCALAEAMLCECVPIVFNSTALPEVVGDCGFYIENLDEHELSAKVKDALMAPSDLGYHARQRIIHHFPVEKRRRELLGAIASLGIR